MSEGIQPGQTVWVSGSAGRLGTAVCEQLREAGYLVVGADRQGADAVDLTDSAAVGASMRGAEAAIHLAAVASPENIDPADLVRNNTLASFTALEQAWQAGIRTAVLASSGSIYGTAWAPTPLHFTSAPVTEQTALKYLDPYALSKDFDERMGQMFHRRGMQVTALRLHWIMSQAEIRHVADHDPDEQHVRNLWGYIETSDAARACVAALHPAPAHRGYETVLVASHETHSHTPTEELFARYLPGIDKQRTFPGHAGAFDISHAARVLGWRPQTSWRAESIS